MPRCNDRVRSRRKACHQATTRHEQLHRPDAALGTPRNRAPPLPPRTARQPDSVRSEGARAIALPDCGPPQTPFHFTEFRRRLCSKRRASSRLMSSPMPILPTLRIVSGRSASRAWVRGHSRHSPSPNWQHGAQVCSTCIGPPHAAPRRPAGHHMMMSLPTNLCRLGQPGDATLQTTSVTDSKCGDRVSLPFGKALCC